MELTSSTTINSFKTGEVCTLVLKFAHYAEYNNGNSFAMYCETFDRQNIVCYGTSNLGTVELSKLKPNDILKLMNVVTDKWNPQVNSVHYNFKIESESQIYLLSTNGNLHQILPLKKSAIMKRSASSQSSRTLKFPNNSTITETSIKKSNITPDHSDKFKNLNIDENCDTVLKIESYTLNKNFNLIFINCFTSDNKPILVVAQLYCHTENLEKNDLVKFIDVTRNQPKNGAYGLRFSCKQSRAFLHYRNGYNYDVPKELLNGEPEENVKDQQNNESDVLLENNCNDSRKDENQTYIQNHASIRMTNANLTNSIYLRNIEINKNCNVYLMIESYTCNNDHNFIFIDCNTSDNMSVTVVALLYFHTQELKKNDVVQFVNVKRTQPKNGVFNLKFHKESRAFLCSRNGQNYDPPIELFDDKEQENYLRNRRKSGSDIASKSDNNLKRKNSQNHLSLPDVPGDDLFDRYNIIPEKVSPWHAIPENEKVTGTLMCNFRGCKHYLTKVPIYLADLLMDNGSETKLVIDAEFAKWPLEFLRKGHRVSVGGKNEKYFGQDARHVSKGDEFDFDDSPPTSSSFQI